jgi:hypothetical protein
MVDGEMAPFIFFYTNPNLMVRSKEKMYVGECNTFVKKEKTKILCVIPLLLLAHF